MGVQGHHGRSKKVKKVRKIQGVPIVVWITVQIRREHGVNVPAIGWGGRKQVGLRRGHEWRKSSLSGEAARNVRDRIRKVVVSSGCGG